MGSFKFYYGPMFSGKSTLALQTAFNLRQAGKDYLLFTMHDRSGESKATARIGLEESAIVVNGGSDLFRIVNENTDSQNFTLLFDEVQFLLPKQIDQIAQLVDSNGERHVDAYAFGLLRDFQSHLFHGSKRCLELADEIHALQLVSPCWCGSRGTHNARTDDGEFLTQGIQVVVGDQSNEGIGYESLCRKHWMRKQTRKEAERLGLVT